jgi:hypothetical protein
VSERRFPVMAGPSVPWAFVEPFEAQAQINHSQSLEVLASRGGLDPTELWCIAHGKRWSERCSNDVADEWLDAVVSQASEVARLTAALATAQRERDEARAELGEVLDAVVTGPLKGKTAAQVIIDQRVEIDALRAERDEWMRRAKAHGCDLDKGDPDCG